MKQETLDCDEAQKHEADAPEGHSQTLITSRFLDSSSTSLEQLTFQNKSQRNKYKSTAGRTPDGSVEQRSLMKTTPDI